MSKDIGVMKFNIVEDGDDVTVEVGWNGITTDVLLTGIVELLLKLAGVNEEEKDHPVSAIGTRPNEVM
jgi:hypothetical protein